MEAATRRGVEVAFAFVGTVFVSDGVSVAYFTVVEVTFGVDAACFTVVVTFGVDALVLPLW